MANAPTLSSVLDSVRPLLAAGASLHWLVPYEKRPIENAWTKAPVQTEASLRASYRNNANIGIRLGEPSKTEAGYLHVFDLDIRKPELTAEAWAAVESLWPGARSLPSVISGSGGESRHLYFLADVPLRKKTLAQSEGFEKLWDERQQKFVVKRDWMIDLFGTGVHVVLPPSIHPDTKLPYRWERPLDLDMIGFGIGPIIPAATIETWGAQSSVVEASDEDDDLFDLTRSEPMDLDAKQIERILGDIPNDGAGAHYDDYVQVGMALHHQFRGANEGFERWCEWAKQSEKFDAKNAAVRWRSFKQDSKNPVRMASLIQIANTNRLKDDHDLGLDDDFDLPAVIPPKVADNDLSDLLGDDPHPAAKAEPSDAYDPDWVQLLHRNEEGELKSTLHNTTLLVENDLRIRTVEQFNEFKQEKVMRAEPKHASKKRDKAKAVVNLDGPHWKLTDPVNGVPLSDTHYNDIRRVIEAPSTQGGYGIKVSDRDLYAAIDIVARKRSFHPIRERLLGTKWDGTPRAATLFVEYLGCPDTAYYRNAATLFLLGAVARVFQPGHKFDYVPILEGAQGQGKSTFIRILGLDWFRELAGDMSKPQEAVAMLSGAWILEIGELSAMQRSEVNDLKAFISRQVDTARMPYERTAREFPRQCVFMGSTNDSEYLRDITGGRRFLPIKCKTDGMIDNPKLRTQVMQIWAEATAMYFEMMDGKQVRELPLYMADADAAREAAEMQESRRVETTEEMLAGRIMAWLEQPIGTSDDFDDLDPDAPKAYRSETCIGQIWEEMLGRDGSVPHTESAKIGKAMLQVGWDRSKGPITGAEINKKYGKCRVYSRP
ncbi:bifunctional DNA primase/polymerase [Mesorhizobium sp. AR07]|uniref:VapE domain-containing protein n=1 Tax=Mesorhizobium sp. AR07 TaxID=2865838 RepID=UPI00215E6D6E|nr:VapE domain-containing protein [Mesorhizobium sp. AR07]UVK46760.1 bifunctional DNA primase/polymerase [Mesorhizobium sp. AR07]